MKKQVVISTSLMAVLLLSSAVGFGQQDATSGSDKLAPAMGKNVTSTAASYLSFDSIDSDGQYSHVSSGVGFRYIGTYSVKRLNQVLTTELSEFTTFKATYPPARYPVKLYRIIYHSVIPEQDNRPTIASGLIAIPETGLPAMPLVSYQHGTVFTKTGVPSHPDESMETRLMIAEFAGQGYAVIGADYFGKGLSPEADSYLVKASTQQACLDMLSAARAVGSALNVQFGPLFLSGWSQGGWSTMVFLNKLDSLGISVKAAAIASAPNDLFAILNRWMHNPAAIDAVYLPALIALQANAYEEYYQLPGLAASAIKAEYLQTARDLYLNKITWEQAQPKLPKRLNDLLQSDFIIASSVGDTRFYRIVQDSQDYRWRSATPLHTYYGDIDEVVPSYIATLPVQYQEIMGGATVTAIDAGNLANHRGTFVYGVADQKKWFDQLIAK